MQLAAELALPYASIALVTDYDCWRDDDLHVWCWFDSTACFTLLLILNFWLIDHILILHWLLTFFTLVLIPSFSQSLCLCPLLGLSSPPIDNIQVMVIVWRLRGNIIRTALCWIVWHSVHSLPHTNVSSSYRLNRLGLSHWDPYAVHRGGCLELYYCNMVEWFWWDSNLILTNWFPSVLWHCWFGHLVCKNRPRNDLLCVEWDVKPYTHTHSLARADFLECYHSVFGRLWPVLHWISQVTHRQLHLLVTAHGESF